MDKNRRTGECHNGFKVTVFDSIKDYTLYMNTKPTLVQKEIIKHALETNVDSFMSDAKKNAKCLSTFPDEHLRIVDMFIKNFLKNEPISMVTTNINIETTDKENLSIKQSEFNDAVSKNNYVKLFGYDLNLLVALILLGGCMLIFSIVIVAYLITKYFKNKLRVYKTVRLNPNRSEAQLI